MSRFSAAFNRLGGPGAVTWWAFGVSLADRLITVSVQPANAAAPLGARILATVLAQLVMFAPLVVLRFTLLKDPSRPRPWVALGGFAVASVVRGLSVDWFLSYFGGLPLLPELRVFSGFFPTIIPLIVVAYVVNTLRERRRELAALLAIREQLERERDEAGQAVRQRNDELVGKVRSVLDAELAAVSAARPADAVVQLQRTATDVVRPLSHELAASFIAREPAPADYTSSRVSWRDVVVDATADGPFMPGVSVFLLSGIWLSAAVVFAPVRWVFVVSLALILGLLVGANALLRSLLPRLEPIGRIVTVLAASVLVALLNGAFFWFGTRSWSSGTIITIAATFYVILVVAGMAVVHGVLSARTAILDQTVVSVEELRLQVIRTQQVQWFHQRALARALHGPVQSAVTAAALRLADSAQEDGASPEIVASVRDDLRNVMDVLHDPGVEVAALDVSLARIVGIWDGLCDISVDVDPTAGQAIEGDPVTRALVIDIVTDAVANAVRHGRARSVSVTIASVGGGVQITVEDDGSSTATPGLQGLGSALLTECAQEWSLTDTGAGHELIVLLPGSARGIPTPA